MIAANSSLWHRACVQVYSDELVIPGFTIIPEDMLYHAVAIMLRTEAGTRYLVHFRTDVITSDR